MQLENIQDKIHYVSLRQDISQNWKGSYSLFIFPFCLERYLEQKSNISFECTYSVFTQMLLNMTFTAALYIQLSGAHKQCITDTAFHDKFLGPKQFPNDSQKCTIFFLTYFTHLWKGKQHLWKGMKGMLERWVSV